MDPERLLIAMYVAEAEAGTVEVMPTLQEPAGGSGWVYTAANYSTWNSANSTDASQYQLQAKYYLESAKTKTGSSSFTSPTGTTESGHSGNGFVRITCLDENEEEIVQPTMAVGEVMNFAYTGAAQDIELTPGKYKLEVWGAQGGGQQVDSNSNLGIGGKGRIFLWNYKCIFRNNNLCICGRTRKNII